MRVFFYKILLSVVLGMMALSAKAQIVEKDVKNATDFELKIRQFIENQQDKSVLLFFYAGHGAQLAGIPHLQGVDERGGNGYSIETLFESLKRVQSAQKDKLFIVIIDACRDEAVRQQKTDLKTFLPPITMVVFATFSGEKALDICGTNGCFTRAFLDALQMPQLTLNDVCNKARQLLMNRTQKQQSVEESTLLKTGFKF